MNESTPYNGMPYTPSQKPKFPTTQRDLLFALFFAVLSILLIDSALWGGFQLSFSLSSAAILALSLFYLKEKGKSVSPFTVFCISCAFLALPVFVLYNDSFAKFWLSLAFCVLTLWSWLSLKGAARYSIGGFRFLFDILHTALVRPFSSMGTTFRSLFSSGTSGKRKQFWGAVAGVLCAVPVISILLPLLISSDAAFEGLVDSLSFDGSRLFSNLFLGLLLFLFLFSILFPLAKEKSTPQSKVPFSGFLNAVPVCSFLSMISLLYIFYLFSQLAYFIGGFMGFLPQDFTLAEYARRGFFEMCIICAINLGLGLCSVLAVRKSGRQVPLGVRIPFLFLCTFSLLMIGCALGKMVLYVEALGMTRLRICSSVFMVMMAFVFLFVILRVLKPKFPYMKAILIAVTLLGLCTAWADINTTIARYNTESYLNGRLSSVDFSTLNELGDAAVPSLITLMEEGDEECAAQSRQSLVHAFARHYYRDCTTGEYISRERTSFGKFNLTSHRAKNLLWEKQTLFEKELSDYFTC